MDLDIATKKKPVTFLDLPPELPYLVYKEALTHKGVLEIYLYADPSEDIDCWEGSDQSWAYFRSSEPPMTKTCRQIPRQALPIFYGENTFVATDYGLCCKNFWKWLTPREADDADVGPGGTRDH